MTNEQINLAIARACGWTDIHDSGPWHNHTLWGYPPMKPGQGGNAYQYLPNYCADLNAMHDAEKALKSWDHFVNYHAWLGYCGGNKIVQLHECITATARQRAEAFLRTLGKWEGGE